MNYEQAIEGILALYTASGAPGLAQTMVNVVNALRAKSPAAAPGIEKLIINHYLSLVNGYGARIYQRKGVTLPGYTPPAVVPLSEMTDDQVIAMLRPYYSRYVETLGEAA